MILWKVVCNDCASEKNLVNNSLKFEWHVEERSSLKGLAPKYHGRFVEDLIITIREAMKVKPSEIASHQDATSTSSKDLVGNLYRYQSLKNLLDESNTNQDAVLVSQAFIIGEHVCRIRVQTC